jgi:hypothetical protein
MLREIRLLGTGTDITGWTGSMDPGTSPYPWANTPSKTLSQIWNDLTSGTPTPPPKERQCAYNWDIYGVTHAMTFVPGPTLALFTKLRFVWGMDYSQEGGNNWWFPPDNAAGPTVGLILRNRAQSGYLTPFSYTFTSPGDDAYNTNTNTEFPTIKTFEHSLLSHPEGGPFTLSDVNHLAAGLSFTVTNGPNGKPWDDPTRFQKFRAFYFALYLTVQDLGGYVRSVRHNASATLRLKRKARSTISMMIPVSNSTKEIGETVNIAHSRGADAEREGWGYKSLERRNGWLCQRTYWPEALSVKDECYDLHDFNCEAWGAFRIPIAWTPELSGMAYLDQGGEWTLTRDQDAWSLRPGDGAALRVLGTDTDDMPNLSEEGLAIHDGGDEEMALWNANLGGAGWSSATTGGASFTVQSNQPMADELGYYPSPLLSFSGTPGTASKWRTFSLTAGDTLSVRARVRNISVDTPLTKFLEAALYDTAGNYWNEATRTWDASPVYNPIASDSGFGETIFDQVPITSTDTYTIQLGRMSSAINTCTFIIGLISCFKNADGCGMPLVTLGLGFTRVADTFEMANDADFTFWHRDRGMAVVEFRPFWRAEDLPATTTKTVVRAVHEDGAYDWLHVSFGTGTAGADELIVERFDTAGTQTLALDILDASDATLRLTRNHYVRAFYRWLDADGWRKHAPYSVLIGYAVYNLDGTFVSYHETGATWEAPDASLEDVTRFTNLDGWIRWFEIKRAPLTGTEAVWRR